MLLVLHPPGYIAERSYILHVLFSEFLGIEYHAEQHERTDVSVTLVGDESGHELRIPEVLFQTPEHQWLEMGSLPCRPLDIWDGPKCGPLEQALPVIYGRRLGNGHYFEHDGSRITLGIDVLGSAFFMLTRYEEVVKTDRDSHDRFPASASIAYQEGFLERPIINEYVEVLWWALHTLWPSLNRKARTFRTRLTHDVDWPLYLPLANGVDLARHLLIDLVRRREPDLALRRIARTIRARGGNTQADLYFTFPFIMELSERYGHKSAFYFITDHTAGRTDGVYNMDAPWIRRLLGEIHQRGHEIGIHPSYKTYLDPVQLRREVDRLRNIVADEGITQAEFGGRQHYLRWSALSTWKIWEDADLAYDSTLGYADYAGFRCGTCWEYPVFNLMTRQHLHLRERPLVMMEVSVLDPQYMNLTAEQAWRYVERLIAQCRAHQGEFNVLWHNNRLISRREIDLYERIVAAM